MLTDEVYQEKVQRLLEKYEVDVQEVVTAVQNSSVVCKCGETFTLVYYKGSADHDMGYHPLDRGYGLHVFCDVCYNWGDISKHNGEISIEKYGTRWSNTDNSWIPVGYTRKFITSTKDSIRKFRIGDTVKFKQGREYVTATIKADIDKPNVILAEFEERGPISKHQLLIVTSVPCKECGWYIRKDGLSHHKPDCSQYKGKK